MNNPEVDDFTDDEIKSKYKEMYKKLERSYQAYSAFGLLLGVVLAMHWKYNLNLWPF